MFAYLDPGSGSMILQVLIGGAAAVAVSVKLGWHRVLRVLRLRRREEERAREPGGGA